MCLCKFYTISAQKLLTRVQLYLNPLSDYPQFSQKHPAPCFTQRIWSSSWLWKARAASLERCLDSIARLVGWRCQRSHSANIGWRSFRKKLLHISKYFRNMALLILVACRSVYCRVSSFEPALSISAFEKGTSSTEVNSGLAEQPGCKRPSSRGKKKADHRKELDFTSKFHLRLEVMPRNTAHSSAYASIEPLCSNIWGFRLPGGHGPLYWFPLVGQDF